MLNVRRVHVDLSQDPHKTEEDLESLESGFEVKGFSKVIATPFLKIRVLVALGVSNSHPYPLRSLVYHGRGFAVHCWMGKLTTTPIHALQADLAHVLGSLTKWLRGSPTWGRLCQG